ncbi:hypothetical protein Cci01nite_62320 [Catellatospora citrea]|uniref:Uncharacterized protein n=1 Tax=Catellatospora citrea TaxID=53366 RepID=A0A8J3KM03_9ACTN|nr:hypothetical protein Cci01nite_62320 [Catellatospora citrea]
MGRLCSDLGRAVFRPAGTRDVVLRFGVVVHLVRRAAEQWGTELLGCCRQLRNRFDDLMRGLLLYAVDSGIGVLQWRSNRFATTVGRCCRCVNGRFRDGAWIA